jgi:RNA polymerase sigma-70 factor (ECF subfamily)
MSPPRSTAASARHTELVVAFVDAAKTGNLQALTALLTDDARLIADGGGKAQAALNVLEGADHVARFLAGAISKGLTPETTLRFEPVNGQPGLIAEFPDGTCQTVAFEIEGMRIRAIYTVRNPDKLRHLSHT